MKALLFYLLQVIITSGILYAWYHFALRNNRFHRYNRFYLLAATVISIIVPFLNIPVYFTQAETDSSFVLHSLKIFSSGEMESPVIVVAGKHPHINWFTWPLLAYSFYILIASLALLRVILSLIQIKRIIKSNPVEQLDNIYFVNTNEPGTPFSFFRWLFWNRKIELHSEKGEQIFRHEVFHITQKHSWDIMFMELLTVIFWINPFFHMMKKEVKAIHEFLADQFTVKEETKWEYAEMLLMQALHTNQSLVNPFFHNQIKRRIAMITTSKKPGYQYLRKLMVLPVAAIIVFLFAFSYKNKETIVTKKNSHPISDTIPMPNNGKSFSGNVKISPGDSFTTNTPSNIIINGTEIAVNRITPEGFDSGKIISADLYINSNLANKDSSIKGLLVLDGIKLKGFSIGDVLAQIDPGNIESVNVLKGPSSFKKYGDDGKNGVIEIFTKKPHDRKGTEITLTDTIRPNQADNKIFHKVETGPSFPGGDAKWRMYLMRNLNASVPVQKKAPEGTYAVLVQFVVDKEGNITDIKGLTNHGFGMEQEAMRVIRSGPKWSPAIQNGYKVNAYKRQPITFVVGNGSKNNPTGVNNDGTELNEIVVANHSTQKTSDKVFDKVETPPAFPGGQTAWKEYLIRNINAAIPVDSGAPPGTYKVIVQFVVHENGSLSDITTTTKHGYGMEKEAIRMIKMGPPWIPARQNGHTVKAYVQQPITFQINEEEDSDNNIVPVSTYNITNTNPGKTTKITVNDLKNLSVDKLLQLPAETKILSFRFTMATGDDISEITNSGNQFSAALKTLINKAEPGKVITFEDVRIISGGQEKKIPPKVFILVN